MYVGAIFRCVYTWIWELILGVYINVMCLCTITFQVHVYTSHVTRCIHSVYTPRIHTHTEATGAKFRCVYEGYMSMYNHGSSSRLYVISDPVYTPRICTYTGANIRCVCVINDRSRMYILSRIYVFIREKDIWVYTLYMVTGHVYEVTYIGSHV